MKNLICILFLLISTNNFSYSIDLKWEDVSGELGLKQKGYHLGIMSGGAAWFDYDNDGWEDLYLTGGDSVDKLFRNLGNGKFEDVTARAGLEFTSSFNSNGVLALDYNNDGYKDIFISTADNHTNLLIKNLGNGKFENVSKIAGITHRTYSFSSAAADFNNDGFVDIYVLNYTTDVYNPCLRNIFYVNNGDGTFTESSKKYGIDDIGCGLAIIFSDYDSDGDVDILIANDFGVLYEPNKLFRNNYPEDSFTDVSIETDFGLRINGMGFAVGDYDRNGKLDYYITNIRENILLEYEPSSKKFINKAKQARVENSNLWTAMNPDLHPITSWGTVFIDVDNDTWLDLFVANGYVFGNNFPQPDMFFHNLGNGIFHDLTDETGFGKGTFERGLAYCDYDQDGDIDIVIPATVPFKADTLDFNVALWRNDLFNKRNWFQLKVVGSSIHTDAFGSKVNLYSGGNKYIREVDGGSSYASHNSSFMHWGLADNKVVDSIEIFWYGTKQRQVLKNLQSNQRLTIYQEYLLFDSIAVCYGEVFKGITLTKDTTVVHKYKAINTADSIVTTKVKVNKPSQFDIVTKVCQGSDYLGNIVNSDTLIVESLTNFLGCDSTVLHSVSVQKPWEIVIDPIVCKGSAYLGKLYESDTTFIEELKSYLGCDSIVTHNISVIEPSETIIDTTICYGSMYDNVVYVRPTQERLTHTAFNGCDSIVIINIDIIESAKSEQFVELCSGDEYNGVVYTSSTNLVDKFETGDGCDSVVATIITVYPDFVFQHHLTFDENETFMGVVLTKDTIIIQNLKSVRGCDSTVVWNLKVNNFDSVESLDVNNFNLSVNPNPFSEATSISWELNTPEFIEIRLYSIEGIELGLIHSGYYAAGENGFNWSGKISGSALSSGVYLCQMKAGDKLQIVKVIINY